MACGNHGMSRLHVWVDLIVFPFGNVMAMGLWAIILFVTGAFLTKKCPVAPKSEMACSTWTVVGQSSA